MHVIQFLVMSLCKCATLTYILSNLQETGQKRAHEEETEDAKFSSSETDRTSNSSEFEQPGPSKRQKTLGVAKPRGSKAKASPKKAEPKEKAPPKGKGKSVAAKKKAADDEKKKMAEEKKNQQSSEEPPKKAKRAAPRKK